jgi:hypothetical protein
MGARVPRRKDPDLGREHRTVPGSEAPLRGIQERRAVLVEIFFKLFDETQGRLQSVQLSLRPRVGRRKTEGIPPRLAYGETTRVRDQRRQQREQRQSNLD